MPADRIPEEYIHYIWQYGLFDVSDLRTTDGEDIRIIEKGFHNHDSGPDFLNARIQIGAQEWAGNVEIHFRSSDWKAHSHDLDEAYDNVILHVVMHHDKEVLNHRGATIPTLSLSGRFAIEHLDRYRRLIDNRNWIPCAPTIGTVDGFVLRTMKEGALVERLEQKSRRILDMLEITRGDWNATLYTALAEAFGGKVNAEPFGLLSRLTPLEIVSQHKDDPQSLEALFIGQAGYLEEDFDEEYPRQLKQQYDFLRHKYRLSPMKKVAWKNSRVRPASLPLIRIAQFSKLWSGRNSLFSTFLQADLPEMEQLLDIHLTGYWLTHYGFDKPTAYRAKSFGTSSIRGTIINTVVPLLFAHGIQVGDLNSKDRAVSLLETLPPEDNKVIRSWREIGLSTDNAMDSQALLQKKKHHCDVKACLQCAVGVRLLKRDEKEIQ